MKNLPSWDLSDLFKSIDDPNIEKTCKKNLQKAKNFKAAYYGLFKRKSISHATLLRALKEYEEISNEAIKPAIFAYLLFTTDTKNQKIGAFLEKTKQMTLEITNEMLFFEIDLSSIDEEKFEKALEDKNLINYRHFLKKIYDWKSHRLSEKEEKILQFKNLTGRSAFERLYDQTYSQQTYDLKNKKISQGEILNILYTNPSQDERKKAAQIFTEGLLETRNLSVYITNTLAADKKFDDQIRNFSFPEQSRHFSNEISPKSVQTMVDVVSSNFGYVSRYYKFKKEVLGLRKIYDYDRYAPVNFKSKKYTFEQAKSIVLEALEKFSPQVEKIASEFFEKNWIDAKVGNGKNSGAYCMYATPDKHPYVFMNFTGSINDVLTLAHELGHAIHGQLARKQSFLNYDWPLTVSETASIFSETIVFNHLKDKLNDKEVLLSIYMHKIESIIASVFRQISMYKFEQDVHNGYRKKGELSGQELDLFWRKRQKEMFGNSIEITKNQNCWWQYVPHFIHSPFYVYAYAFGELLTLSLIDIYQTKEKGFIENYIEFLSFGGSKSPDQLASIFGIDLNKKEFWEKGIELVEKYLKDVKMIYSSK